MDGEYLGPLKKILEGKLHFKKRKVNWLGNHIKSHSQSRRPQPSLQLLIHSIRLLLEFDFCHSKKQNLSGPVGRPDLKLFAQKSWRLIRAKHADQGMFPISGKADHILLSIVLDYCILIAVIFLGNVCQSICSFDVAEFMSNLIHKNLLGNVSIQQLLCSEFIGSFMCINLNWV